MGKTNRSANIGEAGQHACGGSTLSRRSSQVCEASIDVASMRRRSRNEQRALRCLHQLPGSTIAVVVERELGRVSAGPRTLTQSN